MQKKYTKKFELPGKEKTVILREVNAIIAGWGLTMPDDDPLMLHFGLNDFQNVGEIEFWICNNHQEGYCGKFIFLFENQRCPKHYHKIKDETFFVVKGTVQMTMDDENITMPTGSTLNMPVGANHTFAASEGPALVLEVSKPCLYQDSHFDDQRIGIL